jgi:hypothetical protein
MMPAELKRKLRRLQGLYMTARDLDFEISAIFEKYGVNPDNLCASGDGEMQTEALAFITNAEGHIEDNIKEIEMVFLHYANKNCADQELTDRMRLKYHGKVGTHSSTILIFSTKPKVGGKYLIEDVFAHEKGRVIIDKIESIDDKDFVFVSKI